MTFLRTLVHGTVPVRQGGLIAATSGLVLALSVIRLVNVAVQLYLLGLYRMRAPRGVDGRAGFADLLAREGALHGAIVVGPFVAVLAAVTIGRGVRGHFGAVLGVQAGRERSSLTTEPLRIRLMEGTDLPRFFAHPFADGILAVLMVDSTTTASSVNQEDLDAYGLTPDEAWGRVQLPTALLGGLMLGSAGVAWLALPFGFEQVALAVLGTAILIMEWRGRNRRSPSSWRRVPFER